MKKILSFQIPFAKVFVISLIIIGANRISKFWISLEQWLTNAPTMILLHPILPTESSILVANVILSLILIFFLIYTFKLQIFKNPFTKRTLIVFAIGLLLTFALIFLRKFLDQEQELSLASGSPILSDFYSTHLPFYEVRHVLNYSIIHELIFRGIFFTCLLDEKTKAHPILLILGSGLFYPLIVMMGLGYFTFFDIVFYLLTELLFASLMYFSRDIKVPIILRLCLALIHF